MKNSLRQLVIVIGFAVLACAPVFAANNCLKAHIDDPIVVGDQLFSGGTVELVQSGVGRDLIALRIDGEQVAIVSLHSSGAKPRGSRPYLVIEHDQRGFAHIVGLRYALKDCSCKRSADSVFRPLAVNRGLATVPAKRNAQPPEAIALLRR